MWTGLDHFKLKGEEIIKQKPWLSYSSVSPFWSDSWQLLLTEPARPALISHYTNFIIRYNFITILVWKIYHADYSQHPNHRYFLKGLK